MISILQNFVIKSDVRFRMLNDVFEDISIFFKDYDFYVNYNTTENFDKVYNLYKKNVTNLSFYNDLTLDWGLTLQSLLQEVKTDYVLLFTEDFKMVDEDTEYFDGLVNEIIKYDCKYVPMHRIDHTKNYGTDKKYFHLYDTKDYLHLTKGYQCPVQCMSSVAFYNKNFLMDYLTLYNTSVKDSRFHLRLPHAFEWFSHDRIKNIFPNEQFGIPKHSLMIHYEPYGKEKKGN